MSATPARTAVITDTTSYMPQELLDANDVAVVSLYVTLDGEQRREAEIPASEYGGFYERLRASAGGATTSQPSVGDFMAVYKPALERGMDVFSIHLSGGISGTCEAARQAAEQLTTDGGGGDRIRVYDSRSACGGLGLLVLEAARAARAGGDGAAVAAAVEAARAGLGLWFAVDTLEYLRKGGRIGAAAAWLGSALQVKPILTLGEEIAPVERVRTRRRARERLLGLGRELRESGATNWMVQHIQDPEAAAKLVDDTRPVFGCDPLLVSEIGPVIGAHVGPGLLGIGGTAGEA